MISFNKSTYWWGYCLDGLRTGVGFCERVEKLLSSISPIALNYGVEQIRNWVWTVCIAGRGGGEEALKIVCH